MTTICCICGSPRAVENAHPTEKGMGGRGSKAPAADLLMFPLCADSGGHTLGSGNTDPASCHGAHHAGYLSLSVTAERHLRYCSTSALSADTPDARRAHSALNSRGVKLDGLWHLALYEAADPDALDAPRTDDEAYIARELGDVLHTLEAVITEATTGEATAWRKRSDALGFALQAFSQAFGDKRGRAEFTAWREQLGITASEASKMLTVAKSLPESSAALPARKQYQLARALEAGIGTYAELLAKAEALSASDFHAECWPAEDRPAQDPVVCPIGLKCPHREVAS